AKRLGIPPPPELATFGLADEEKKKKRTKFIKEVFVTKNIRVDGMEMNLIPPPRIMQIQGVVINEPKGSEDQLSAKHQLAVKGVSECKASENNVRCIHVKDIIKEVKDHLKTYSLAGMDTS
nr:hypothetical protein [Tanacetum cinerariifolium]